MHVGASVIHASLENFSLYFILFISVLHSRIYIANITRVNDTIIGDPLFTVPLRVTNLEDVGLEQDLSLCYEVHGEPDR